MLYLGKTVDEYYEIEHKAEQFDKLLQSKAGRVAIEKSKLETLYNNAEKLELEISKQEKVVESLSV